MRVHRQQRAPPTREVTTLVARVLHRFATAVELSADPPIVCVPSSESPNPIPAVRISTALPIRPVAAVLDQVDCDRPLIDDIRLPGHGPAIARRSPGELS